MTSRHVLPRGSGSELTLIAVCISLAGFVRDWWENGEHVTGVVVEVVQENGTMTIRDPATEQEVTVDTDIDDIRSATPRRQWSSTVTRLRH